MKTQNCFFASPPAAGLQKTIFKMRIAYAKTRKAFNAV